MQEDEKFEPDEHVPATIASDASGPTFPRPSLSASPGPPPRPLAMMSSHPWDTSDIVKKAVEDISRREGVSEFRGCVQVPTCRPGEQISTKCTQRDETKSHAIPVSKIARPR